MHLSSSAFTWALEFRFCLPKQAITRGTLKKQLVHESSLSEATVFTYEKCGWWHCVSTGLFKKRSLSIFFFEINRKLFYIQLASYQSISVIEWSILFTLLSVRWIREYKYATGLSEKVHKKSGGLCKHICTDKGCLRGLDHRTLECSAARILGVIEGNTKGEKSVLLIVQHFSS